MNHCTWKPMLLFSLRVSVVLATATSSDAISNSSSNHGVALVEWLRSRNGIFNENLEIRRADTGDSSSRFGIFATQDIETGELLIAVPSDSVITDRPEDVDKYESALQCSTAFNLIHEMRLGNHSEFAPYVRYLLAQSPGQLPSAWSNAGKDLLMKVLGEESGYEILPPEGASGWIEPEWREECNGSDDPLEENAAMLVVQRSWDHLMIPVYDMLSHRNGKWLNSEDSGVHEDKTINVRATRDIEEGDEIYTSYNFCTDCGNRALIYGTPEIFRDYGFVEAMPQRWIFEEINVSFELNEIDGPDSGILELSWFDEPSDSAIDFLSEQLQRLNEISQAYFDIENDSMPKHEWDVIWQYHQAITIAITHAIQSLRENGFGNDEVDMCPGGKSTCSISERYNALDYEEDELDYNVKTCDKEAMIMEFEEYEDIAQVKSAYQTISYFERPGDKDMCFDLDDTVQICSSYRPHYHESVVHYTARYIDNVRRVVFVGGGDSMLLHEVIKYPNLELVMGLELDQKVTRNSFKYFGSQPHFDDERVEWWFGDATKSLLMLPRDYFGSFDMVLVDLSETVMSFLVTDGLDVMEALALLLKLDGVFVKNELYMTKMSEMFDYAIQIYWPENPVICDQSLILGSNGVDFLHHPLIEHNIENLWIEPLDINDHFGLIHDYSNKSTGDKGQCEEIEKPEGEYLPQVRSAGILMIVEAEDATIPLHPLETIELAIFTALGKEGLTPLSTVTLPSSSDQRSVTVIIMREGYVVARLWPEHDYCAFDIHLWGEFKHLENARSALIASVGSSSKSSSSYRIVVGGMFGASTWRHDQENLGPIVRKSCDSEGKSVEGASMDQTAIDIVMEESMNLVQKEEAVVAVLCGDKTQSCNSLDVLVRNKNIKEVIALWTCPTIKDISEYAEDGAARMFACENDTINTLKEFVDQKERISALVVDPSAPIAMAKIAYKILSRRINKKDLFMPSILFIAPMLDKTETWRRNFLEKCRKSIIFEPLSRAEIVFNSSNTRMEMGVMSSGDPGFFLHLLDVTKSIKIRSGLDSDIRNILGGIWNYQPEYNPKIFLPGDYDQVPSQEQNSAQRPLGHQTIFQLEAAENGNYKGVMSTDIVKKALDHTLLMMNFDVIESKLVTEVGDGCMIAAILSEGSVIVLWDGQLHVDINLFTYTENVQSATQFSKHFITLIPETKVSLRDEQPRGIGRVVNCIEDIHQTAS